MRNVYTVAQVNAYIKNMFAQDFLLKSLTVKGELSNIKYHSSGHIYFTLKDKGAAISCVMFRSDAAKMTFKMVEGQQVNISGTIDVYERDGKYQMYARRVELDGAGQLYEKFEQLKHKLEEQGMFAQEYKRAIPKYIKTLGVVTAPTGAAVRDIINISTRRNPYVQIILYPAIVQGDQAAESIVRGIKSLSDMAVDVIIVGRGGGSIEDLWAFNEEIVAEAIFDSPIPIISAVGHETDTTISDYVSDMRAPTPSAAAELAVYEYRRLAEDISDYKNTLLRLINRQTDRFSEKADAYAKQLKLLSPEGRIRDKRMKSLSYLDMLTGAMNNKLTANRHRLEIDIERMKRLSPLEKLNSGFSYVSNEEGKNIKKIADVNPGDMINVYVSDGSFKASVTSIEDRENTEE
ncbi:MAG: exodeoxyribonuclease VII large subunit [Butyrivibrio sp.]|nr:exodeoxyribonuclease VII large subunit [Butyrivibrio sp.]